MTKNVMLSILFSVSLSSTAAADTQYEVEEFHEDLSCTNLLQTLSTPSRYLVESEHGDFYAEARIIDHALTFDLQLKGRRGERHPDLSGEEQFERILRHFPKGFTHITDFWEQKDGRDSDNLKDFKKALAEGHSPEEAAALTWTGQHAGDFGYKRVNIVSMDLDPKSDRQHVVAEFWPLK